MRGAVQGFAGSYLAVILVMVCLALGYPRPVYAAEPNHQPVASGDTYTTPEDTVLARTAPEGVLANDLDPDGDPLQALLGAGPYHGELALSLDGSFVYTPSQDFAGLDLFQYQASDGISATSPVSVWLNVTAINDPPVASDNQYNVDEDNTLTVVAPGVLGNASDVDGNSMSAHLVTSPQHGVVVLALDGSFTYSPAQDFYGDDGFTYKVNDGQLDSTAATVTVTVASINDPPTAVGKVFKTDEDVTLFVSAPGVLANASDPEGEDLSARLVTPPEHGVLVLDATGGFVYTPTANYHGYDAWEFVANDGHDDSEERTIYINVKSVNDTIPVAQDDGYEATEDTPLTIADPGVLVNDSDADGDPLERVLVTEPLYGLLVSKKSGGFTYTPNANYNGIDTFSYQASDGQAKSVTATVTITISAVNDAPQAQSDDYQAERDEMLSVPAPGLLGNDSDVDGDMLSAAVVNWPQHGWLLYQSDGSFDYFPYTDYTGSDSFTYRAFDGVAWSALVQARVSVVGQNRAPTAVADQYTTDEDVLLSVPAPGTLANDTDVDTDPLSAILASGPSHGTLTLNGDGSFEYSPSKDYSGDDTFSYKAHDGSLESNVVTVAINIVPVNDAPVALDDTQFAAVQEDKTLTVAAPGVLQNDTDTENNPLTATLVQDAVHGEVTLQPDGAFTYTPDPDYYGSDSFTYRAGDGGLTSNDATVSLTVTPINDKPAPWLDEYTVQEDTPFSASAPGVLSNDKDVDSQTLSVLLVHGTDHGELTLNSNGSFHYSPEADYYGRDRFTYRAFDGQAYSLAQAVTIQVSPVNDGPIAGGDSYALEQDGTLTLSAPGILGNDVDVDSSNLAAVLVSGPSHGTLSLSENGGLSYVPNKSYTGRDSFTYQADDGSLKSAVATVQLTIGNVDDGPVATGDTIEVVQGETVAALNNGATSVLANDSAPGTEPVTAVLKTQPTHGELTLYSDGTFTYVHDGTTNWSDSFTYVARQNGLDSNVATVVIEVQPQLDFEFTHTAGIAGLQSACTVIAPRIPSGTVVQHCFTLRNTGSLPLDVHGLTDSRLGTLLENLARTVQPGMEYTHMVTESLTADAVSTATWTAAYQSSVAAAGLREAGTDVSAATLVEHTKSHTVQVSILVSTPADDQDGDGIPDNVEGAGDADGDNIPNFLDANADGDSATDQVEAGADPSHPLDSDGDGIPDFLDPSTPGDGTGTQLYLPAIQSNSAQAAVAVQQEKGPGDSVLVYLPTVAR